MKVLLISICVFFAGGNLYSNDAGQCASIQLSYESREVKDKIVFSVQARGGTAPYYYFFLDKNLNMVSLDVKKNTCSADKKMLPKLVRVVDSGGCSQTLEFNETNLR